MHQTVDCVTEIRTRRTSCPVVRQMPTREPAVPCQALMLQAPWLTTTRPRPQPRQSLSLRPQLGPRPPWEAAEPSMRASTIQMRSRSFKNWSQHAVTGRRVPPGSRLLRQRWKLTQDHIESHTLAWRLIFHRFESVFNFQIENSVQSFSFYCSKSVIYYIVVMNP